ncbi:MAG: EAL domain-containing protein, partial [Gammaproteobacteria bacterium]|nr:EAL domain-containing protein [Gammaproteobacteria bacterium]
LILGTGETYLLAGATDNVRFLKQTLGNLAVQPLLSGLDDEVGIVRNRVIGIAALLDKAARLSDGDREQQFSALLLQSDTQASELVTGMGALMHISTTRAKQFDAMLEHSRYRTMRLRIGAAAAFGSLILILWMWTTSRVSNPVQDLTRAVEHAMEREDSFTGVTNGPHEIMQLNGRLAVLIERLEDEVERRTLQLTEARSQTEQVNEQLREKITEQLASEQRFRSAFGNAPVGMALLDAAERIIQVNATFAEILGFEQDNLLDMGFPELLIPDERPEFLQNLEALHESDNGRFEIRQRYQHRDGSEIWCLLSAAALHNEHDGSEQVIVQLLDVTEAQLMSEAISYQARHDSLTGLLNRREFDHKLDTFVRDAEDEADWENSMHVLCYLDLDQFKVVNDSCGHLVGDKLLKQVAETISGEVRSSDRVARLGGDEFGILLRNCSIANAQRTANSIRERIANMQIVWEGRMYRIGASIGLVEIRGDGRTSHDLMSAADTACYAAKNAGRDQVHVYDPDDDECTRLNQEMECVSQLHMALDRDLFTLVRQPIIPLQQTDSKGQHYEILLRMQDASGQHILPGTFLPAAERYNLITRIDRWVVRTAITWLKNNPAELNALGTCSINLSGQTLSNTDLLNFIYREVMQAELPHGAVCFEITETAAITEIAKARKFIEQMKAIGCRFALDDFGRGLSSFGYLKNLPVDYVKIDGEFIRNITRDTVDLAMVRSINEVAHASGKKTIAEFVEDAETAELLRRIGVDYAQGYYFGKPADFIKAANAA